MKKEHRKSEKIDAELQAAIARAELLKLQVEESEKELAQMRKELVELSGNPWNQFQKCKISRLQEEYAAAKLYEQDQTATTVYYVRDGKPYESDWDRRSVVSRITPKRIYVREEGCNRETYYNLDGTDINPRWSQKGIDLARTFPEGIDAWIKANK